METADLSHHISRRFNEDLEKVRNQVLQMGGFVEQQLHKAITALVEGDSRLGDCGMPAISDASDRSSLSTSLPK